MKIYYKILLVIILLGAFGLGMFYLGKKSVKVTEKVEYIEGEPIRDSIPYPEPYEVLVPVDVDSLGLFQYILSNHLYDYLLPIIVEDSLVYMSVDTMQIIKDFLTINSYDITLFDIDTVGKCEVYPVIQYNRIKSISYEFTPIYKHVIKVKDRKLEPFIGVGLGGNNYSAQAGIYVEHNYGINLQYLRNKELNTNEFLLNALYKF